MTLNFTLYNETGQLPIKGSLASTQNVSHQNSDITRQYTFSKTDSYYQEICIYPPWTEYIANTKSSDYDAEYYQSVEHFLTDATIDNQTNTIPIYLPSGAAYFTFKVEDENEVGVNDVLVKFKRYYPAEDKYKLVTSAKTAEDGTSAAYLILEDVKYQVILQKDNDILRTYSPRYYNCINNPCQIFETKPTEYDTYFEYEQSLAYQCNFNVSDKNQLVCDVNDQEGMTKEACLDVDQLGIAGKTDYDEQCGTSSSMVLKSNLTDAMNSTVAYTLRVEFDDGTVYTFVSDSLSLGVTATYGMMGVFMTFLTFLVLSMIGIFDPGASILLGVIALILSALIGFLAISTGALASIVIVGAVLVVRMR